MMHATPVLDQEFLLVRARLLEIAAALDRLDRANETNQSELRLQKIRAAIKVLAENKGDRAEQLQLVFSQEYEDDWRTKFGLTGA